MNHAGSSNNRRTSGATVVDPNSTGRGRHAATAPRATGPQPGDGQQVTELPEPGERIGKYELIRELGRGGMGAVFLARDTKLGRRVAIKFLQSQNPELNARFILEARATAQFQHENIIVIHEVDEYQGNPFMVLEYLQGSPLNKLLENGRSLTPRKAVDIMIPVVRALERAHAHNIVHRDLKPDNIFLTDAGTVKVLDFGIAKLMHGREPQDTAASGDAVPAANLLAELQLQASGHERGGDTGVTGNAQLTRHGAILGTLPYMSPEQWGAGGPVDHRTDLWACGILLFRMVAGKHPLGTLKGAQLVVTAMLEQPMPRARAVSPDVPEEIAHIIDRCLVKHKERRMGSANELLEALEELAPSNYSRTFRADQTPYAGLSSFQESDAARFFGRSREIAAAVTRLGQQPLMGVVGPSGVGKSSFVRAGVVPALKHSGEQWSTLVVRPGRQPVAALAQAISPMVSQGTTTTLSSDLEVVHAAQKRLYQEPGYLGVVLRSRARRKGQKILVFIDQFEELYTLVPDVDERLAFTRCLASVADDATAPLRVVLAIRSDFLDRVPEDEQFMAELAQGLFFLTPPGRAGLRDALIQPAQMVGYQFEDGDTVEHMLDHLEHTSGALPLLQFAATKLWDMRDAERRLFTSESYRAIGGIAGALASHADSVITELPPRSQKLARAIFLRLVTPERTRAIVGVDELAELSANPRELSALLEHLANARLIVMQVADGATSGAATAEIVHESLLTSWPRLKKWLDENQDDAAFLEQLRNAARQWQTRGFPPGLLWRGEAMEEARLWHRRYKGELPALQVRYLEAVFSLAGRSARRKRYALIGAIVFLSLLVTAGAVALVVISDAQREATEKAAAARTAEQQVRDQFDELEQARTTAETAKDVAESERRAADEARKLAEQAKDELQGKNQDLVAAITRAERARERAEKAKRRERRQRRKARDKEREATEAAREAREAKADLEELLEEARERNRKLEEAGTTDAIDDVSID